MLGASLLPGTLMFILGEEGWTDDGGGGTLASRRFPCGQDVDSDLQSGSGYLDAGLASQGRHPSSRWFWNPGVLWLIYHCICVCV